MTVGVIGSSAFTISVRFRSFVFVFAGESSMYFDL